MTKKHAITGIFIECAVQSLCNQPEKDETPKAIAAMRECEAPGTLCIPEEQGATAPRRGVLAPIGEKLKPVTDRCQMQASVN